MANSAINESVLSQTLADAGLEDTDDNRNQLRVMLEAMCIYEEREAARGGLWKAAGAIDSAHHLRSKARRIVFAVDAQPEAVIDDGLDAVNYAVFAVRNVRAGRLVES
jgi:hypothetical protein